MAARDSAGIALCRPPSKGWASADVERWAEVLIVHPGGPLWAGKDQHAWSIPKGEFDATVENSDAAASREFAEELGVPLPGGAASFLGSFKAGRKTIWPWLLVIDSPVGTVFDHPTGEPFAVESNLFEMEWPPKSQKMASFSEVDVAQWVPVDGLAAKLHKGQSPLVPRVQSGLQQWSEQPNSFSTW